MVKHAKTSFFCLLCQKEVGFENPWYEKDVHMLRMHQEKILKDAVAQYLKPVDITVPVTD